MNLRWDDYVIALGGEGEDPESIWQAAAAACGDLGTMYVLGVGFDPRALVGLRRYLEVNQDNPPVVGLIELPPPSTTSSPSAQALSASNMQDFEQLTNGVEVRTVVHEEVHSRTNAGPRVARALTAPAFLVGIGHLVIDISSLPSTLYFPMIAATLTAVDRRVPNFPREVQVVACENPSIDSAIAELGITDAVVVGGFRGLLDDASTSAGTVIWAPVLGEHSEPSLEAIHDFLGPGDVCPVLPFPASNPRRSDDLVRELQVRLFDVFGVTPANLIYADERNPFDLYRTLSRLQRDMGQALKVLGPTTLALSTHSSKLLSLGALLAAFEHDLPIVAASAMDYDVDADALPALAGMNQLTCAWLTGLPYQAAITEGP